MFEEEYDPYDQYDPFSSEEAKPPEKRKNDDRDDRQEKPGDMLVRDLVAAIFALLLALAADAIFNEVFGTNIQIGLGLAAIWGIQIRRYLFG